MHYQLHFARHDACPPVLQVLGEGGIQPHERLTLPRVPGECSADFVKRAQIAAQRMFLRSGCKAYVRIECCYDPPSPQEDPGWWDDERCMSLTTLRTVLNNEREPAEVRIAAAKALNRMHHLVPFDTW